MAYATKTDIEIAYGKGLTTMIIDHGQDLIEDAQDSLDDATNTNQPQTIIDDLTTALIDAQNHQLTAAETTIQSNLDAAASIIDSHIKSRYPRAWTVVPVLLKSINVDIAVHRMSLSADWRTDEMTSRYKIAKKYLEDIRDGLLDLIGEMEASEDSTAPAVTGGISIGQWVRS